MSSAAETLRRGLEHQQSERWSEALADYRSVLGQDPTNSDALHLLGVIAAQTGEIVVARDLLERAIQCCDSIAVYHHNLGCVLHELGASDKAREASARAAALDPRYRLLNGEDGLVLGLPERPKQVFIPWSVPAYRESNGEHPLLSPLAQGALSGMKLVGPKVSTLTQEELRRAAADFAEFTVELMETFHGHPVVRSRDISEFVATRGLYSHLVTPPDSDLVFHHTTPRCIGDRPWVLHLESVTPLFLPFLRHGRTSSVELLKTPIYWLVRYLLERPNCRAIFTHLRRTAREIVEVFASETIRVKTRFIPLGVPVPKEIEQRALEKLDRDQSGSELMILFTNSWHQDPFSFFLRGGLDLLDAFWRAREAGASLRLALRTALPDALDPERRARILRDPCIQVIDQPVSEEALLALYDRAAVFAIPSAGLHSLSVLRAMGYGAVCVTSDAPGYEELIEDGKSGLIVPGRRDPIYSVDPVSGWLRDDYTCMVQSNPQYAERLARVLLRLWTEPKLRREIGCRALERVSQKHDFESWARGVEKILTQAV